MNDKVPPALEARPELPVHLEFYFEAWQRLSQSRSMGMSGPSPISFQAMTEYCRVYGLSNKASITKFVDYLQALDGHFIQEQTNNESDADNSEDSD